MSFMASIILNNFQPYLKDILIYPFHSQTQAHIDSKENPAKLSF